MCPEGGDAEARSEADYLAAEARARVEIDGMLVEAGWVVQDLEKVETQLSLIDAQARAIAQALARSAALRRAILERAFTGRLVSQDPDDEPASILLERIRSERPVPKKSRRAAKSAV